MTTVTEETLKTVRLALYQLRQDVGVPETAEAAATDASVTWTKCRELFDVAFGETLDAHAWTWKRGAAETESVLDRPDAWPSDARNALVYCLARELAVPVAGRVEDMKNCNALYQEKLRAARIHDLEAEWEAEEDPDRREVLAAVVPTILSSQNALPMDLVTVTRRIDAAKEHARSAILTAHNWSFARGEAVALSCECAPNDTPWPFSCRIPAKCARVLECRTAGRRDAEWRVDGLDIRSDAPVESISYIRDETRLDRWPPLVRAAYCALLAAEVAGTTAGSAAEAQRLWAVYERKLEDAKLYDSRASAAKPKAYRENYYADAMRGGRRGGFAPRGGGAPWRW